MLRNYLLVAFRTFRKHRTYTLLNLVGLAVAFMCAILIYLFIQDEFSFDTFHVNKDRIFRVVLVESDSAYQFQQYQVTHPYPLGPALQNDLPEVAQFVRFSFPVSKFINHRGHTQEEEIVFADSSLFSVFSFPVVYGDAQYALTDPSSVAISEKSARKYFGDSNPVGNTLSIRVGEEFEAYQVTAVFADIPSNSTIQADFLLPMHQQTLAKDRSYFNDPDMNLWWVSSFQTYVLLKEQALTAAMSDKLAAFRRLYFPDDPEALQDMTGKAEHDQSRTYHFQPLPNIHLDTTIKTKGIGSNPVYSYILAAIGGCILLLASINFTMLTISRSHFRAKDVGVRKVVGARRYQLMLQHWTEAILLCGIAFLLACILSGLVLPLFNDLAQKSLSFMTIIQGQAIVILVSLVILIGILAGAYPALILSGLSPLMRMKGAGTIPQGRGVSKVLLGIQFVLPLVFLTVTLVMIAQLRFLQQKDLGFQPQQVLVIENPTNDSHQTFKRFAQQAERLTGVSSITATNAAFTRPSAVFYMRKSEEEPMRMTWAYQVKANYFELLDIPLVAGRTFNEQRASDATEAVIVNETFVSDWGLTDPIGQQVEGRTIIGVVPDFQYQSLKGEVEPLMFTVAQPKHSLNHILVKLQMDQAGEVIPALATLWEGLETALPFQYSFLDQDMAALYEQDVRWMRIIQCIAVVSISIACLGLIGMIGLVIARRTKEIGIRKVLGASVHQLWWLLSSTYIRIVVIATLVAIPIANYLTGEWLQNFAYRIKLPWWLFALASILFLLLTVLSVGQLIWKAATRNPVESLRYE